MVRFIIVALLFLTAAGAFNSAVHGDMRAVAALGGIGLARAALDRFVPR